MKNILSFLLISFTCIQLALAQEKESSTPLIDKASEWWEKANPFKKDEKSQQQDGKKAATPSIATPKSPAKETPSLVEERNETRTAPKNRFHVNLGIGNVTLQGNSGSVVEKNYDAKSSAHLGLNYEIITSEQSSFETGLSFLLLSSQLKYSSSTHMNLNYLAIPLVYKRVLSKVAEESNFYGKVGVLPLILLGASVDTCSSTLCGADSDLDAWLTKSRSISDSFQKYSALGTVGLGFNFLIFKEFIIDSFWFNADLSYNYGLTSINRGSELGSDVRISGAALSLGLAISF